MCHFIMPKYEEEEDGAQTGLGDYGFGTTASFKDRDDEKVAIDLS